MDKELIYYLNLREQFDLQSVTKEGIIEMITRPDKNQNTNNKCICLCRVSSQAQDLEQQTEKVKQEALKDGYNDENIIVIEDKESAVLLSEEERLGLTKMKWHIENETIKCVYVWEVSRISRQPAMLYGIRDYLINHGVQLIVMNPYMKMLKDDGTLSETANIFFGIFSSLSENEGYLRKRRCKRGIEKKKALNKHAGGPIAIGYTTDKEDNYIIDEEGAKWVRRIFNDYVDGWSVRKLARQLQNEGWRTKTAFLTICQSILDILHREYYCGDRAHPAIISRELYDKAQEIARNKTKYQTGRKNEALLKGMMYDAESGYLMSSNMCNGQYYSKRYGHCTISIKAAEMVAAGVAREWYAQMYDTRKDEHIAYIDEQIQRNKLIVSTMESNITANQDKIDRISERYIEGKLSKQKADEMEKRVFENIQIWRESHKKAQFEIQRLNEMKLHVDEKIIITDIREIVRDVIKRVEVRRLTRFICEMKFYNKYTGEVRTIQVNTRKFEIVGMKVDLQQALPHEFVCNE